MNLNDDKKLPLRLTKLEQKKTMLINHYKQKYTANRSRFVTPTDYVKFFEDNARDINSDKLLRNIESLRIELTNKPVSWVKQFGQNQGLTCILAILNNCYESQSNSSYVKANKVQHECIKCVKALMNNTVCLV